MIAGVRWVADSGHAWLRVPIVSGEGLTFSEYSYVDRAGGWLFLEEDCDAGVWLAAHGFGFGDFPTDIVEGEAACRRLPRLPMVRS